MMNRLVLLFSAALFALLALANGAPAQHTKTVWEPAGELTGHTGEVVDLAFRPDGKLLLTAGRDGTVRLWDMEKRESMVLGSWVNANLLQTPNLSFSSNGNRLGWIEADDAPAPIVVYNLNPYSHIYEVLRRLKREEYSIGTYREENLYDNMYIFTFHGETPVSVDEDERFYYWNWTEVGYGRYEFVPSVIFRLYDIVGSPREFVWNPKPSSPNFIVFAFTTEEENVLHLRNDKTDSDVAVIGFSDLGIYYPRFSPDGTMLAFTTANRMNNYTIKLWSLGPVQEIASINNPVYSRGLAFSSDGKFLATAGWDSTTRLWDIAQRQELAAIHHLNDITYVAFSPDGKLLAVAIGNTVQLLAPRVTAVEEEEDVSVVPQGFALRQNYPNPFNPETSIVYELPEVADVHLVVYDLAGRTLSTLVQGHRRAGRHTVVWDGRDDGGQEVASGVYLYRLTAGPFTETKKMVIVR